MRLRIIAVGQRLPDWQAAGIDDYLRRMPPAVRPEIVELASGTRRQRGDAKAEEGERILACLRPRDRVVALAVDGRVLDTAGLAASLERWRQEAEDLALVIGGADGLAAAVEAKADRRISLSALTLPHGLARLVLVEQLYRAHSLLAGHPYHRV